MVLRQTRKRGGCGCALRRGGGKNRPKSVKKSHRLGPRGVSFKAAAAATKKPLAKSIRGLSGKFRFHSVIDPIERYCANFARFIVIFIKTYVALEKKGKLPANYRKYAVDLAANLQELFVGLNATDDLIVDDLIGLLIAGPDVVSTLEYLQAAAYVIDNFKEYNNRKINYDANIMILYGRFHDIIRKGPAYRRSGAAAAGAGAGNVENITDMFAALGMGSAAAAGAGNSNIDELAKAIAGVAI